jgi:transitional endoplasmic reticulum ATPase
VEDADDVNPSVVHLNQERMTAESLFRGDTILVSFNGNHVPAIVLSSQSIDASRIAMNKVFRYNLQVRVGETVAIRNVEIPYGTRIRILPTKSCLDSLGDFSGDLFTEFLKPYFLDSYRAIASGKTIFVPSKLNISLINLKNRQRVCSSRSHLQ